MITVFTPTYNRAYIITKLYFSLEKQTSRDFEWLVVDDGSSDETERIVSNLIEAQKSSDSPINIRYVKQENGGKHRAINRGVQEARGELFFIVDSDDCLCPDAVEWAWTHYLQIRNDEKFAGLSGMRMHPDGVLISGGNYGEMVDVTRNEVSDKYHLRGDYAEMYKTEVMKKFPFPDIPGERFCSEGLIWTRILQHYYVRYFRHPIYVCDYLQDGLTVNKNKCRLESPNYSMLLYAEQIKYNPCLTTKVKHAMNFWRFSFRSSRPFSEKCQMVGFPWTIFAPIGWLLYLRMK